MLGWDDERVLSAFRFEGVEQVEKGLADGNGRRDRPPHTGNWDVGGTRDGAGGSPVVSVAEHLKPEPLFELFLQHRAQLGMEIIDLASDHVGRQLTKKLEENRIIALVADRDLSGGGVEVEMFGRRTRRMPAGPASCRCRRARPSSPVRRSRRRTDGSRC